MTQFTTELLNFLAQKQDIDEFFRTSLETAMNDLLPAYGRRDDHLEEMVIKPV